MPQEPRSVALYTAALDKPLEVGIRQSVMSGLSIGGVQFIMFCSYAVALFYGAHRCVRAWLRLTHRVVRACLARAGWEVHGTP